MAKMDPPPSSVKVKSKKREKRGRRPTKGTPEDRSTDRTDKTETTTEKTEVDDFSRRKKNSARKARNSFKTARRTTKELAVDETIDTTVVEPSCPRKARKKGTPQASTEDDSDKKDRNKNAKNLKASSPIVPDRRCRKKTHSDESKRRKGCVSAVMVRVRSEGVSAINSNILKFNDAELKEIEDYLLNQNAVRIGDMLECDSRRNKYRVLLQLGVGRYSTVHIVEKRKLGETEGVGMPYAMKADMRKHRATARFEMERYILKALIYAAQGKTDPYRFPLLADDGFDGSRALLIMNILGPDLRTLRERVLLPTRNFHPKTAVLLALESLQALMDLHSYGFLHRDVKPANFCIGPDRVDMKIVHLCDFGASCKIDDRTQRTLLETELAFPLVRDSLTFGCIEAHLGEPHGIKSDLTSWLLVVCDLFDRDIIAWKNWEDSDKVFAAKKAFLRDRDAMSPLPGFIADLARIIEDIPAHGVRMDNVQKLKDLLLRAKKDHEHRSGIDVEWAKLNYNTPL